MSAACAWRFSGRSRLRASRSTSSARSRFSWVRSSFSCARRRRLRCLPSPAASSTSSRRSRGFEWTISSTRPWLITECISRPRFASASTSITSTSRQRAPFSRYSPSPLRSSRRLIEISENSLPAARRQSELLQHDLDLGVAARRLLLAAREDHVLHGLAADRERALLPERPEHGVGDVRLAAAVRADDHADAGREHEPGALREGLEALDRDRAQVHGIGCAAPGRLAVGSDGLLFRRLGPASYRPRRSSASAAAACSAAFLLRPSPLPITSASQSATTSKRRSWGGPASWTTS